MIAVFYLLVYLLKGGNLPGTNLKNNADVNKEFQMIRDAKMKQRTNDICFGNTKGLSTFKREVFSYRFRDEPRYEFLRDLLSQLLLQESEAKNTYEAIKCSKQTSENSSKLSSDSTDASSFSE